MHCQLTRRSFLFLKQLKSVMGELEDDKESQEMMKICRAAMRISGS